jgi:hypothetical protein
LAGQSGLMVVDRDIAALADITPVDLTGGFLVG